MEEPVKKYCVQAPFRHTDFEGFSLQTEDSSISVCCERLTHANTPIVQDASLAHIASHTPRQGHNILVFCLNRGAANSALSEEIIPMRAPNCDVPQFFTFIICDHARHLVNKNYIQECFMGTPRQCSRSRVLGKLSAPQKALPRAPVLGKE